ncbi:hypothetical protein SAMN04488077_12036 [Roseovarius tolerans]|uniref:Uncharacterized protein n=1 Tax=Roseovarius tolerans TaxID=74031 RepID=A0A1H8HHL8_9RHOB|nr:hypothetical protein [Roseovarius tolerans]SEN55539.1 hypothetical protein SAMN04488077_12036 [Roseovarius tolerans]
MHRKFIAFIIGSAMTVTSLAASPVEARDRGEAAAIIAGVAALAIVGAAIADNKRDKRRDYVSRGYGHKSYGYAPRRHNGYRAAPRQRVQRGHPNAFRRGHYGTRHYTGQRNRQYGSDYRRDRYGK